MKTRSKFLLAGVVFTSSITCQTLSGRDPAQLDATTLYEIDKNHYGKVDEAKGYAFFQAKMFGMKFLYPTGVIHTECFKK